MYDVVVCSEQQEYRDRDTNTVSVIKHWTNVTSLFFLCVTIFVSRSDHFRPSHVPQCPRLNCEYEMRTRLSCEQSRAYAECNPSKEKTSKISEEWKIVPLLLILFLCRVGLHIAKGLFFPAVFVNIKWEWGMRTCFALRADKGVSKEKQVQKIGDDNEA